MKRRTHSISYEAVTNGPTQERLRHAGNSYVVGGDARSERIWRMLDAPLERLYARLHKAGGDRDNEELAIEYAALVKYRALWCSAGLEPSLPSVDLGRIFASDPTNFSGMAKSERQAHCRGEYRRAVQILGMIDSDLVERVVCREIELPDVGYSLGYTSSYRARQAAERRLRDSGRKLADHWGIG